MLLLLGIQPSFLELLIMIISSAYAKRVFRLRISIFYLAGRDLIILSIARLKSTGQSAFFCLRPVIILKMSDSLFANFILQHVSVLHSFINLTNLVGMPNSSSAAHNFPLIILSYVCFI